MTIVIWITIAPPHGPPLTQSSLCGVDLLASRSCCFWLATCLADSAARCHQLTHEPFSVGGIKGGIAQAPESVPHNKIAAVWRAGISVGIRHEADPMRRRAKTRAA
jgi:hypothetical protein